MIPHRRPHPQRNGELCNVLVKAQIWILLKCCVRGFCSKTSFSRKECLLGRVEMPADVPDCKSATRGYCSKYSSQVLLLLALSSKFFKGAHSSCNVIYIHHFKIKIHANEHVAFTLIIVHSEFKIASVGNSCGPASIYLTLSIWIHVHHLTAKPQI